MPSVNPRQRRAESRGRALDASFFATHPERDHHSRPALPFEAVGWKAADHVEHVMIVRRAGDRTAGFPVRGRLEAVPDSEIFLALLWSHIVNINPSGGRGSPVILDVTPQAHAAMLRISGIEVSS